MRDFCVAIYEDLLTCLIKKDYNFQTFYEFIDKPKEKVVVLRHDVDLNPKNSLDMAKVESELGVNGTYYFRIVPESFDEDIILQIVEKGHEVGYHYEDIDLVEKLNDFEDEILIDRAYESFCKNLERFRKLVPINTICMHGSPKAKFDNKIIWNKYKYKDFGIIGEPYFDVNWNETAYLTDTGRRWNGDKFSVRDKVNSRYQFDFKKTINIINNVDKLPIKIMFTIHPQRWNNNFVLWAKEFIWQNSKNMVKYFVVKKRQ